MKTKVFFLIFLLLCNPNVGGASLLPVGTSSHLSYWSSIVGVFQAAFSPGLERRAEPNLTPVQDVLNQLRNANGVSNGLQNVRIEVIDNILVPLDIQPALGQQGVSQQLAINDGQALQNIQVEVDVPEQNTGNPPPPHAEEPSNAFDVLSELIAEGQQLERADPPAPENVPILVQNQNEVPPPQPALSINWGNLQPFTDNIPQMTPEQRNEAIDLALNEINRRMSNAHLFRSFVHIFPLAVHVTNGLAMVNNPDQREPFRTIQIVQDFVGGFAMGGIVLANSLESARLRICPARNNSWWNRVLRFVFRLTPQLDYYDGINLSVIGVFNHHGERLLQNEDSPGTLSGLLSLACTDTLFATQELPVSRDESLGILEQAFSLIFIPSATPSLQTKLSEVISASFNEKSLFLKIKDLLPDSVSLQARKKFMLLIYLFAIENIRVYQQSQITLLDWYLMVIARCQYYVNYLKVSHEMIQSSLELIELAITNAGALRDDNGTLVILNNGEYMSMASDLVHNILTLHGSACIGALKTILQDPDVTTKDTMEIRQDYLSYYENQVSGRVEEGQQIVLGNEDRNFMEQMFEKVFLDPDYLENKYFTCDIPSDQSDTCGSRILQKGDVITTCDIFYITQEPSFCTQTFDTTKIPSDFMTKMLDEVENLLNSPQLQQVLDILEERPLTGTTEIFSIDCPDDVTPVLNLTATNTRSEIADDNFTINPPPSQFDPSASALILPLEQLYPHNNENISYKINAHPLHFPKVKIAPGPSLPWYIKAFRAIEDVAEAIYTYPSYVSSKLMESNIFIPSNTRLLQESTDSLFETIMKDFAGIPDERKGYLRALHDEYITGPIQYALSTNQSWNEMISNITAKSITLSQGLQYKSILMAQYAQITDNKDVSDYAAAQTYKRAKEEQEKIHYKQILNALNYEDKVTNQDNNTRILQEGSRPYTGKLYRKSILEGVIYEETYVISDLDQRQFQDLQFYLNLTITQHLEIYFAIKQDYLHLPPINRPENIFYKAFYAPKNRGYSPYAHLKSSFDADKNISSITFTTHHIEAANRQRIFDSVLHVIKNIFTISVDPDLTNLISAVNDIATNVQHPQQQQGLYSQRSLAARFTVTQTNSSYFTVLCDGSYSYSLWSEKLIYYWDMGDGTKIDGENQARITHIYKSQGTYTVSLKVKDTLGLTTSAMSVTNVKILYTLGDINSGKPLFISGRNQYWMFVAGYLYEPIKTMISGANIATLFTIHKVSGQNNIYTLEPHLFDGAKSGNLMGFWYYNQPTKYWEANFVTDHSNVSPIQAQFTIEEYEDGYYVIKKGSKYLTIIGTLVENEEFDENTCTFTFVENGPKPVKELFGMVASVGKDPLNSLTITNFINSGTSNSIKLINPSNGGQLFNFVPNTEGVSSYNILDMLNQDYALTSHEINGDVNMESILASNSQQQIWNLKSVNLSTDVTTFELFHQIDATNRQCLHADLIDDKITINDCGLNSRYCSDLKGRMVYYASCTQSLDSTCCGSPWLLLIPFSGKRRYAESCHACKSGHWYCTSALNEYHVIKESKTFKQNATSTKFEPCTVSNNDPVNAWILEKIDPTLLFWQKKGNLIGENRYIRENVKLFNLGQQSSISFQNPPRLSNNETEDSLMYIHTFSFHGRLDDINDGQAGFMFSGVGNLRNRYLTGDFNEENLDTFRTDYSGTHGHFWHIWTVGFNVFQFNYGWQGNYCLSGVSKGGPLKFTKCNANDKNQLWSINEF